MLTVYEQCQNDNRSARDIVRCYKNIVYPRISVQFVVYIYFSISVVKKEERSLKENNSSILCECKTI